MMNDLAAWARAALVGDILPFWEKRARDRAGEGFLGEITFENRPRPQADRSIVMVSRHLWTFSAAARFLDDRRWLETARAAYAYLLDRFLDKANGGFYWTVKQDGSPAIDKKQIYGQAFAVYALAEFSRCPLADAAERARAAELALATFAFVETWACDRVAGGYLEARAKDWSPTDDRVLSPVDLDCDKSMNTNLHVLEAWANLLRLKAEQRVALALFALLDAFARHIVRADGHLGLFFKADWTRLDSKVSYGHDIEASWLIEEAVELLERTGFATTAEHRDILARAKSATIALAESAYTAGWDRKTGGLEEEAASSARDARRDTDRIWWCQAETMVGFTAAWKRTGDAKWLDAALATRNFIEKCIKDPTGDWYWGVSADGQPLPDRPKGGNWKTGYHNGRMCMEIIERLEKR